MPWFMPSCQVWFRLPINSTLATVWHTALQLKLQNVELVHTSHMYTTILATISVVHAFYIQLSSNVSSLIKKGTWVWMGLVLWTVDVLSGGKFSHKSHLLPTECLCVRESGYSIHGTTECTLSHVHWEWLTGLPYMALQVLQVCGTDNSTTTTSDQLFAYGSHYANILLTWGGNGTLQPL